MKNKTRLERVRGFVNALESEGLTPFDLLSWTTLLYLTDRTGDLNVTHNVQDSLERAICQKAEDLDELNGTDFHRKMIKR